MDAGRRFLLTTARVLPGRRALAALAASLSAHLLVLAALAATGVVSLGSRARLPVSLVPLTPEQWAVNRLASGGPSPPVDPVMRYVDLPLDADRDPLRKEAPPLRARHLAVRDQSVADERVSRDAGVLGDLLRLAQLAAEGVEGSGQRGSEAFSVRGRPGPRGAGGSAKAPPGATAPIADPRDEPGEAARTAREKPPSPPPGEAVVPLDGAEGGQRVMGERVAGLPPRELPRSEGGPNFDGLDEVPEGDETRLDAHEVGAAGFWIDVRDRIELEWQKRAVAAFTRLDPLEDVYLWKPRTAVVKVALGAAGELRKVEVVESSTLVFFDDVALEAVRAGVYPPPPPDALGGEGEARIRVRITWLPSQRRSRLR